MITFEAPERRCETREHHAGIHEAIAGKHQPTVQHTIGVVAIPAETLLEPGNTGLERAGQLGHEASYRSGRKLERLEIGFSPILLNQVNQLPNRAEVIRDMHDSADRTTRGLISLAGEFANHALKILILEFQFLEQCGPSFSVMTLKHETRGQSRRE